MKTVVHEKTYAELRSMVEREIDELYTGTALGVEFVTGDYAEVGQLNLVPAERSEIVELLVRRHIELGEWRHTNDNSIVVKVQEAAQ